MFLFSGLMILGTDTEVGKTFVACRILESLVRDGVRVGAYKPVASGAPSVEESDGFKLWQASGCCGSLNRVNPQSFAAPVAPPIAAEMEQRQVDDALILDGLNAWRDQCDFLIVEGAGGLMSPISWTTNNADIARKAELPVVLVASNRLGVVNQVLTTWTAARALGLEICCIVVNQERETTGSDPSILSNARLLQGCLNRQKPFPLLTYLKYSAEEFEPKINWKTLLTSANDSSHRAT